MTATLLKTETLPIGTRFDYSMTHADGTVGYTHVLVRPDDVIRRDIVPATAEKPAKNAKYGPSTTEKVTVDGKEFTRTVRGPLLDPGTNEVPLLAKAATEAEVQTYLTTLMAQKEAAWAANKPVKAE